METKHEGPSSYTIPAKEVLTCTGCKHLEKTPGLRGRNKVTNNYNCKHPNAPERKVNRPFYNIGFNVEGSPVPPHFCPFNI